MDRQTRQKNMGLDLTQGNIAKLILRFFLPFLLANILNSIYNTVDTIIIGQFVGADGITASSTAGRVVQLFTYVAVGLASGGQTVISQLVGAKKREELNETIGTMLSEMFVISIIVGAACALFTKQITTWLNTPEASLQDAERYLFITACGLPLIFGYNSISAILRAMGDSKKPLIFIAIAAAANVIGDILLVGVFDMGVKGAAVATVAAQGISFICSLVVLYRQKERFGFDFKLQSFRIKWNRLKPMLKVGLPMALRELLLVSTRLIITGAVNLYEPAEIAAYNISDKFYSLANIFAMSTRQAAGTMVAQNIGADRQDRVKLIVRDTLLMNLAVFAVIAAANIFIPVSIFSIFTNDPTVLKFAPTYLLISCITFFFSGVSGSYDSVITGTGNSFLGFLGGVMDGVVLRLSLGFILGQALGLGVTGFFLGDGLSRIGVVSVSMIYYYSGKWKTRKKLIEN